MALRGSTVLTTIRVFVGLIFMTYGLVKIFGGQYYYGDWVIDKKTVDGPSLVWAFFGYSPIYGRFTALFELVPAILLLIPRTATIGAAALFAVSLNITVMDFAYGYPSVKYLALLYTVLLAVLLWADRYKLLFLLEDSARARAAFALLPTVPASIAVRTPMSRRTRRILLAGVVVFVILAANLLASSLSGIPVAAGQRALEARRQPGERIELLRARQTGLIGLDWISTMEFVVTGQRATDTVTVRARKITGFLPWRVVDVGTTRR